MCTRRPSRRLSASGSLRNAGLATLLQADEQSRTQGQPLLTEAGAVYVRQALAGPAAQSGPGPAGAAPHLTALLPRWDREQRRLWLGPLLLKEYRQPAPNQTALLEVFQEQSWFVTHIDDPLSPQTGEAEEDVKRRLRATIKNMNRGLPPGTIRFRGDGTGEGVVWEYDHRRRRA